MSRLCRFLHSDPFINPASWPVSTSMPVSFNSNVDTHMGHDQLVCRLGTRTFECIPAVHAFLFVDLACYQPAKLYQCSVKHLCPTGSTVTFRHRSGNTSKGCTLGLVSCSTLLSCS